MGKKQKVSHDTKLQTPSIPDLCDGLANARMRLNRRNIKHLGRKLKDGPLLNALVAWFLAQGHDEQARIAAEGLACFEAMLGGEDSPSVPAGQGNPGRRPTIGIAGSRVDDVDRQGEHKAPKGHRAPKR